MARQIACARPAPEATRDLLRWLSPSRPRGEPTPAAVLVRWSTARAGSRSCSPNAAAIFPDHPGQIQLFRAARVDRGDQRRAQRHAARGAEEVGLPRERVTLLGRLAEYETVTGYRVTPVVGWVEPPFEVRPDPVEVADVFEVPLAFLLEPAHQERHFRMLGELRRDYYAIPYGERYIWGATAAMLMILDRTLRAA